MLLQKTSQNSAESLRRHCILCEFNNRQNQKISEETRRKVLDAVEALHYYPNASAKSMRTKNCTSIGIVCAKDYSRQAFLNAFTGISQYLSQIDYTITIFNEMDDIDSSPDYVKSYYSNVIDGLIFISNDDHAAFTKPADENHIPYVVICMDGVFSKKTPSPMHLNMPCRNVPPSVWKRESAKCGIFPSAMTVF